MGMKKQREDGSTSGHLMIRSYTENIITASKDVMPREAISSKNFFDTSVLNAVLEAVTDKDHADEQRNTMLIAAAGRLPADTISHLLKFGTNAELKNIVVVRTTQHEKFKRKKRSRWIYRMSRPELLLFGRNIFEGSQKITQEERAAVNGGRSTMQTLLMC